MPEVNYDRINRFCNHAVDIANDDSHGYSQYHRWGPDFDCSSLMYECAEYAGYPISQSDPRYTGSMIDDFTAVGYRCDSFDGNLWDLERGDILLHSAYHTAVYIGDGQIVEASCDEYGGIEGANPGDQTGFEIHIGGVYNYPWTHILTPPTDYAPDPEPEPEPDPGTYEQYVIDVSEHNGKINWQAVKDAGWHAIIRVGYGDDIESQDDKCYLYNVGECERLGIPHGVYIYSYAYSTEQAISEAEHVLRLIKGRDLQYPVYFDSEESGTEGCAYANAVAFCNRIQEAGYWAGIYSGEYWWNANLHGLWDTYTPWVAKWGTNTGSQQTPPYCPYDVWQYSSEGDVPGVGGRCDVNISVRNFPKEISGDPTPPTPQPTPTPSGAPENIRYAVKTAEDGWLPFVTDLEDYAGIQGHAATYLAVDMHGHGWYQVKSQASGWLPPVRDCNINDYEYGCAGDGSPITAVRVCYETQNPNQTGWWKAKYRVSNIWSNYYDWQYDDETSNGQDGYAGDGWNAIDRVQITLSR